MIFDKSFILLIFCQFFISNVVCDFLTVNTKSGRVRGIQKNTIFLNKPYISFRGIPYAEPPIGNQRYQSPVPNQPWTGTLLANQYRDACITLPQSNFPSNATQSEDCLYLNVFTPVLGKSKKDCLLPVMFFIHGGFFISGDGQRSYYGPDQIIENDVILVTVDYRLGPFGFMNFELPGYTGNMGLKDQQLALKWTHKNIKYFGGDPNAITFVGQSVGGVSAQLHVLNKQSSKYFARAVALSGTPFVSFGLYAKNNQLDLMYDAFKEELNNVRDPFVLLQFLKTAPVDLIVQKTPPIPNIFPINSAYWTVVIEDESKAVRPFLTETPRQIYQSTKIDKQMVFGFTRAESLSVANIYDGLQSLANNTPIGLPFLGLTLSPDSNLYKEKGKQVYDHYFGNGPIQNTTEDSNRFVQMASGLNFHYGIYEGINIHKCHAKTFGYLFDISLGLNFKKIQSNYQFIHGAGHLEDIPYIFYSHQIKYLYDEILRNPDNPENRKTLNAIRFVSKYFTDIVKNGHAYRAQQIKCDRFIFSHITNDGIKTIKSPKIQSYKLLQPIYKRLKPYILNGF